MSNEELIIAFASITKINKNRYDSLIIVDYIGSIEVAPKDIISSFNYKRFRGKGLGKLLLTIIQSISNVLCKDKDNAMMLKCTNELRPFYESIGFNPSPMFFVKIKIMLWCLNTPMSFNLSMNG